MTDLSARMFNPAVERVSDRIVALIDHLEERAMSAGSAPFTEVPKPEIRWLVYSIRPVEEWRFIARTDPDRALDEARDFANMARRRGLPEAALDAARAVLSEASVQEVYRETAGESYSGLGAAGGGVSRGGIGPGPMGGAPLA